MLKETFPYQNHQKSSLYIQKDHMRLEEFISFYLFLKGCGLMFLKFITAIDKSALSSLASTKLIFLLKNI